MQITQAEVDAVMALPSATRAALLELGGDVFYCADGDSADVESWAYGGEPAGEQCLESADAVLRYCEQLAALTVSIAGCAAVATLTAAELRYRSGAVPPAPAATVTSVQATLYVLGGDDLTAAGATELEAALKLAGLAADL